MALTEPAPALPLRLGDKAKLLQDLGGRWEHSWTVLHAAASQEPRGGWGLSWPLDEQG